MATCLIEGCDQPVHGRGLCQRHYNQAYWGADLGGYPHAHRPLAGRECEVDGCGKPAKTARYCSMHAERLRRFGALGAAQPQYQPDNQSCSVDGCDRKAKAQGYCYIHYQRWRAHGDPGSAAALRRRKGTGTITASGYVSHNTSRNQHKFEHHRVWERANGPIPEGHVLHHVNGDRRDNRLENLQLVTRAEHVRLHRQARKAKQ